jgi:hypothetical protein
MSSDIDKSINRRARSPAYPVISLRQALESARKVWDAQRKADAHIDSTLGAMGLAKHGASLRLIAALGHYGLIEETGSGESRRIRLSALAQDLLLLEEQDPRRKTSLEIAALYPAIHAALWERYGKVLPPDSSLKSFLIRDKGYNEEAVEKVISNYKDSFELANLDKHEDANAATKHVDPMTTATSEAPKKNPPPGIQVPGGGFGISPAQSELPILIGDNRQAKIPFPMTQEDYDLLIATLEVWKKRLIKPAEEQNPSNEGNK